MPTNTTEVEQRLRGPRFTSGELDVSGLGIAVKEVKG